MKFTLNDHPAQVVKYNPRSEKHGDEREPAADVVLEFHTANYFLDHLDPDARKSLFKESDDHGELPLEDEHPLTELRMPSLNNIMEWSNEMPDAIVTIKPSGDKNTVEIKGCKINKFVTERFNGGGLKVKMRVEFEPTEKIGGRLSMLDHVNVLLCVEQGQPQSASQPPEGK